MGQSALELPREGVVEGAIIAGKYRVERVIGEGAMGVVLAARHLELDEQVAIKFIRPEMHTLPDVLSRFAREAKASAHLKCDHVAKVLDVGVAMSIGPFIVMEYLDGQNLAVVLQEGGPLPVRRAAEYVMQVCEALALAHASSITHRDVKPENLFLTRRGDLEIIKVLDFGISKSQLVARFLGGDAKVRETSCLMGTPLYMSPEQIRATHDVDQRTDIWSLGVVLFELLTGRPAFAGETVTQVCALVLESTPPRLLDHCPSAPEPLSRVIERCLEKDPKKRFQSAAELANALLPFAPSRARLHAERAMSVLKGAVPLLFDEPPVSSLPLALVHPQPSADVSPPTVFGAEPAQGWARPSARPLLVGLGLLLCVGFGFLAVRFVHGSGGSPASVAVTPPAAPALAVEPPRARVETALVASDPKVLAPERAAPSVTPGGNAAKGSARRPVVTVAARRKVAATPTTSEPSPVTVNAASQSSEPSATTNARARLLGERRQTRLLE